MFRLPKLDPVISVSAVVLTQTTLVGVLAYLYKTTRDNATRYADAVVYYESVLRREDVTLTDYDLIALNTIFAPDIEGLEE